MCAYSEVEAEVSKDLNTGDVKRRGDPGQPLWPGRKDHLFSESRLRRSSVRHHTADALTLA